jgi:hypothetical protein
VLLAAWIALAGTLKMWNLSFGQMLLGIANLIDRIQVHLPFGIHLRWHSLANAFRYADNRVKEALSTAIYKVGQPIAVFIDYMATVLEKPTIQLAGVVADVAHTLGTLRHDIIPRMITARIAWIPKHLRILAARILHLATHLPKAITHEVTHLRHYITHEVTHVITRIPVPRISRVEREAEAIGQRLKSLARHVAGIGALAYVAAELARLGLGWIRCSKVKRVGKTVCGLNENLLEGLLADALLVVGAISIVEFAKELQAIEGEVVSGLRGYVREI